MTPPTANRLHPDFARECELLAQGCRAVCGVDEAGAGPLAGRVYAAAVILPPELSLPHLNDSKKLSEKWRETLYTQITQAAVAWAVAWAEISEIESLNIFYARLLAMSRAVERLTPAPDYVLVDGTHVPALPFPAEAIRQGDAKSASIAAASILAKVTRDRYMIAMDRVYPGYGFARHKGYGTEAHYEALARLGPCDLHRPSFLRRWRAP